MTYKVVLIHNEEGWAAYTPSLPGCATQGTTEQEALENIRTAIREYLEVASKGNLPARELEVALHEVQVA